MPTLDTVIAGHAVAWRLDTCGFASILPAGRLVLIDDDAIELHNLNRLFFASVEDARADLFKVDVAASLMARSGWVAEPLCRKAEHPSTMNVMANAARRGAVLVSAVGEPMTRRFLAEPQTLRT